MEPAYIIDAKRTPVGRYGGALSMVRPDDMAAAIIKKTLELQSIDQNEFEDVILGCANQAGEDNRNVARMALLLAGMPVEVGGVTVNRLCASGLQAIMDASRAIAAGDGGAYIAGGVESMSRAPFVLAKAETAFSRNAEIYDTSIGWRFINQKLSEMYYPYSMGETAENVAEKWQVKRDEQDEFAYESQKKWKEAHDAGKWQDEIIPVEVPQRKGDPIVVDTDEHPRPDTTIEKLEKLKPAFKKGGTVTAGNSSGVNDGAAALIIVSEAIVKKYNLQPMARVVAGAVAGTDPACMGIGPVPATQKALKRAGLKINDIDLIELNEAFAAQSIACIRELDIDEEKVNVNGGSIAIGHPLGCSGARITATLLHEMKRRKEAKYGLATMCVGVGQGAAIIYEKIS